MKALAWMLMGIAVSAGAAGVMRSGPGSAQPRLPGESQRRWVAPAQPGPWLPADAGPSQWLEATSPWLPAQTGAGPIPPATQPPAASDIPREPTGFPGAASHRHAPSDGASSPAAVLTVGPGFSRVSDAPAPGRDMPSPEPAPPDYQRLHAKLQGVSVALARFNQALRKKATQDHAARADQPSRVEARSLGLHEAEPEIEDPVR